MLSTKLLNQISRQLAYLPLLFAFIIFAGETKAATYELSYTLLSGSELNVGLQGDLQADNNSVHITALDFVDFDGVPFFSQFNFLDSNSQSNAGPLPVILSLDGTELDFRACFTSLCNTDAIFFISYADQGYFGGPNFGLTNENVDQEFLERYSLVSVPEPHVLSLLLIGLIGLVQCNPTNRKWARRSQIKMNIIGS